MNYMINIWVIVWERDRNLGSGDRNLGRGIEI